MAKILVVDDSAFSRRLIIDTLKTRGYRNWQFIEANNGEDAVKQYKKKKPDLVLMDIIMPRMHGPEAAKKIIDFDKEAKIIMVSVLEEWSSSTDNVAVERSKKLGIKAYVQKPIDKKKLVSTVKEVLG